VVETLQVNTDRHRFFQVLTNLIGNALKFTNSGSVIFGFELKDQFVLCFVKDTGMGIEPVYLETIFDRFNPGNPTGLNDGTGLGLAIGKSLVGLLGGEIWVKSKVGVGSEFYFTIPLKGI